MEVLDAEGTVDIGRAVVVDLEQLTAVDEPTGGGPWRGLALARRRRSEAGPLL